MNNCFNPIMDNEEVSQIYYIFFPIPIDSFQFDRIIVVVGRIEEISMELGFFFLPILSLANNSLEHYTCN